MQFHNTIDSKHLFSLALPYILSLISICYISMQSIEKIPPVMSAICISLIIIGNIIQILYAVQLFENMKKYFGVVKLLLYVYHFNILIISITAIKNHVRQQLALMKDKQFTFKRKWVGKVYNWVDSLSRMSVFIFVTLIVVIAILEIILILFGQGVDGPVKAFTMTADWTFSTQIPPPPIDYQGHYLCTVAARGHEKIVKPLRYGKRRGAIIIVNRQLEVANAFEDFIQEKMPNFHKHIRHFYDTYGYPLSKKITNKTRADIVYILMKPLEWMFVLFLYTFDAKPEERIERQYRLQ